MQEKLLEVLLIEDSLVATRRVQKMLAEPKSSQFKVKLECADRLSLGKEYLAGDRIDIVLLDLMLPDSNGLDTFKEVLKHAPMIPIVVMSGFEDETLAVEAVKRGAQDYLVKGRVDSNLLMRAILYAIERKRAEKLLREAQEKLAQKEKLTILGQLAGGVAHKLRNSLGTIKNATYFLNIALEDSELEVEETLKLLDIEVETSERIIRNLLNFARLKPPIRKKVDVRTIIQDILSRNDFPEKVKVLSQLSEELPDIEADPDQLGQVFENIILNAIHSMLEGGQLSIKARARKDKQVAISITDTGFGIPEQNLSRLFEPLFSTKARGIGLGLAITKSFVEGHGGSIEVKSKIGKGSTFTVNLPLVLKS